LERNQGQPPAGKRESSAEILGRYSLLAEIAAGDLTAVHLARQHGDAGFQRLVALRRLRPMFARQPECVQLLLDEARLAAGLHHANVVGCLDVGTEGGCYVVQNYVEGDSLDNLLVRAGSERHARYTVPLLVDVLNGLHAVHMALDDESVPLLLVHQAPCARHVLVGIDGIARLTDFTQAKTRVIAPSRQRAGRLKLADMAPEQALNPEDVDHRTDLFLVGVTLWKALTGERLFDADGQENTFQQLMHRRIPRPSEVGLKPPRCFDAICLRALEREPDKRYRSALDMARELRDTALNHGLYATTDEIGQWVKALAGPKLIERRKLAGFDASSQELHTEVLPSSSSGFFQATRPADPYGSGFIFGGSFSRLDQLNSVDLDKTPAIRMRARDAALPKSEPRVAPRREGEDEPTARHNAVRARKSTEAMWALAETKTRPSVPQAVPAPITRALPGMARKPSVSAETLSETHPNVQVSARPSAPAKPVSATMKAHPSLPPSQPAAGASSRPVAKSKPAIDSPSPADHRNDSTPTRMLVPSGPVGSLYRGALPSQTPIAFEPPSVPRALGKLTEPIRYADARMKVDSLAPPTSAQRTTPPVPQHEQTSRSSRAMWLVTGLLAAIILLAAGVSVRNWQNAHVQRVTATQPKAIPAKSPKVEAPAALDTAPLFVAPASPAVNLDPPQDASVANAGEASFVPAPQLAPERPLRPAKRRARGPLPIPDNPY
jgi:eukaryotic-like serine/threonine-protein kinase